MLAAVSLVTVGPANAGALSRTNPPLGNPASRSDSANKRRQILNTPVQSIHELRRNASYSYASENTLVTSDDFIQLFYVGKGIIPMFNGFLRSSRTE
jgi:hypothetical protein